MKIRYIAPLAMVATAAAIGLAPLAAAAATTTNTGAATVVESPGNAQITTEPGAAALQSGEQQYPFFGYGGRVAVPPRRPPLTAVPFVCSGGSPSPARSAHRALAKPAGRRWRTLGSGPPDRAGHLRTVQVPTPGEYVALGAAWQAAWFSRGRIRRRNGCPVPPNHSPPRDARGGRSVSGGSAADLGPALIR